MEERLQQAISKSIELPKIKLNFLYCSYFSINILFKKS